MKDGIRLVCFDLDKTLIKGNSWYELNLAIGVTENEDALMFSWYEDGIITYQQWIDLITSIAKKRGKASRVLIEEVLARYAYVPGARDVIQYVKERGYMVALISGSTDILVNKVGRELGISYVAANNRLVFNDEGMLEKIVTHGQDDQAKLHLLQGFCKELDISITECACIGDGDNDRELFLKSGKGITFEGSKIQNIAWKTVAEIISIKDFL